MTLPKHFDSLAGQENTVSNHSLLKKNKLEEGANIHHPPTILPHDTPSPTPQVDVE